MKKNFDLRGPPYSPKLSLPSTVFNLRITRLGPLLLIGVTPSAASSGGGSPRKLGGESSYSKFKKGELGCLFDEDLDLPAVFKNGGELDFFNMGGLDTCFCSS